MRNTIIALIVSALICVAGCSGPTEVVKTTTTMPTKAELIAHFDHIRVYRIYDGTRIIYIAYSQIDGGTSISVQ